MINHFDHIIVINFISSEKSGEPKTPLLLTAKDVKTGVSWDLSKEDLNHLSKPPFPTNDKTLIICYQPEQHLCCYLSLGWEMPVYILSLFAEFRVLTNGKRLASGGMTLMGALNYYGLCGLNAIKPKSISVLKTKEEQLSENDFTKLTEHSKRITKWTENLFHAFKSEINLPLAILRGRYCKVVAKIEANGVPVDKELTDRMQNNWGDIKQDITQKLNEHTGIKCLGLSSHINKKLAIEDSKKLWPEYKKLSELHKYIFGQATLDLPIGNDGYNRTPIVPFKSKTGRNQPSSNQFIYGLPSWTKSIIKPKEGYGLAYIDWHAQEFGIAAALSADIKMQESYHSEDPYLNLAILAKLAPRNASLSTHQEIRDKFKIIALAMLYGMGHQSLASKLNINPTEAIEIQRKNTKIYKQFYAWQRDYLNQALLTLKVSTVFGWHLHIDNNVNNRTIVNFPVQSNAAEMLRIASILISSKGIRICALVHDAIVIESPLNEIEVAIKTAQESMKQSSKLVLNGFELKSDVTVTHYPNRVQPRKGSHILKYIHKTLSEIKNTNGIKSQLTDSVGS